MTWRERIAAARKRGRFTKTDVNLAAEWSTCAAGEHDCMPWNVSNLQVAIGLIDDGAAFAGAVARNEFDTAEQLLDSIEDLALRLKREA